MKAIHLLRERISTEEFDYGQMMESLSFYKKPRDVVTHLIKDKSLFRVKKGLYVFGRLARRGPICKESLANLIYGPSYISLEYALRFYGLIPERVEQISSMTPLRSKTFNTPLGVFEYVHLHPDKMAVGVTQIEIDPHHQILIATPEKALADRLSAHKDLLTSKDVQDFVCGGLRIDEESLKGLNISLLNEIELIYHNQAVSALSALIRELSC